MPKGCINCGLINPDRRATCSLCGRPLFLPSGKGNALDTYVHDFEEAELQRSQELLQESQGKKCVSPLCFFPELHLKPPYTHLNLHPFWVGLPYYKTLIFDIFPFPSEEVLRSVHGVSVKQILALQDEGRLSIVLAGAPKLYSSLNYLRPILERRPPSYPYRIQAYLVSVHGESTVQGWREEAISLFWGRLEKTHKLTGVSTSRQAFEGSVLGSWVNLRAMGLDSLAQALKEIGGRNPDAASVYLELFHEFLCAPTLVSLGGCPAANAEYFKFLSSVLTAAECGERPPSVDFPGGFPTEVGKILARKYKLVRPQSMEDALDIYPDYEEARSAMRALLHRLEENRTGQLEDEAAHVAKVFDEVHDLRQKKRRVQTILQVSSVIGCAAAGISGGAPGILAALGFGFLAIAASGGAEALAKLGVPSSIVTLYDFEEKTKVRSRG